MATDNMILRKESFDKRRSSRYHVPRPTVSVTPAINATNIVFSYGDNTIVNIEHCQLNHDSSMTVIGPSGCGKTTLLHLLAGLIHPDSGTIRILGQDLTQLTGPPLDRFRGQNIGLIFQRFHLLPALNVRENILLAQRISGTQTDPTHITTLLNQLDLTPVQNHKPSMLSQGQAQRVAIARALVHSPKLIIADEPTSALDDDHAEQALTLLQTSAQTVGAALLVITHDQRVRGCLDSEFEMQVPQ